MKDTVKAIIESSVLPEVDFLSKNTAALNILDTVNEADRRQLAFIPQKVTVMKRPLKEGYLVEEGTHNELLRRSGLYYRLYSLQNESMDWTVKAQI